MQVDNVVQFSYNIDVNVVNRHYVRQSLWVVLFNLPVMVIGFPANTDALTRSCDSSY